MDNKLNDLRADCARWFGLPIASKQYALKYQFSTKDRGMRYYWFENGVVMGDCGPAYKFIKYLPQDVKAQQADLYNKTKHIFLLLNQDVDTGTFSKDTSNWDKNIITAQIDTTVEDAVGNILNGNCKCQYNNDKLSNVFSNILCNKKYIFKDIKWDSKTIKATLYYTDKEEKSTLDKICLNSTVSLIKCKVVDNKGGSLIVEHENKNYELRYWFEIHGAHAVEDINTICRWIKEDYDYHICGFKTTINWSGEHFISLIAENGGKIFFGVQNIIKHTYLVKHRSGDYTFHTFSEKPFIYLERIGGSLILNNKIIDNVEFIRLCGEYTIEGFGKSEQGLVGKLNGRQVEIINNEVNYV